MVYLTVTAKVKGYSSSQGDLTTDFLILVSSNCPFTFSPGP